MAEGIRQQLRTPVQSQRVPSERSKQMIGHLLPPAVAAEETFGDDEVDQATLFPEERKVIDHAVTKRQREFTAVRACARRAMARLDVSPVPIVPGERGAPRWPRGLVGSMTHCEGYRAAALARSVDLASIGIDAEPHEPLPDGVFAYVSLPAEQSKISLLSSQYPSVHWDRLLFSAKEAVYKAWFPLTGEFLKFDEANISLDITGGMTLHGQFQAEILVPAPIIGSRRLSQFEGRWTVGRDFIRTAVAVPHMSPSQSA